VTPHVARCAEAVQHNNCRTTPSDAYVDREAVGFDLMRLHRSRKGMDTILMSVIVHRSTPNLKGTRSRKLEEKLIGLVCSAVFITLFFYQIPS
jgi:hypothetical protein